MRLQKVLSFATPGGAVGNHDGEEKVDGCAVRGARKQVSKPPGAGSLASQAHCGKWRVPVGYLTAPASCTGKLRPGDTTLCP